MTAHLASFGTIAGLWLALVALTVLATSLVWRPLAHATRAWHPERRADLTWLAAIAPVALPSLVVLLCALPGLAGALAGVGDHCRAHADHPHFCPIHATVSMTPLLAISLAALAACLMPLGVRAVLRLRADLRETRWLARRRASDLARGVHLVRTPEPIALTHGLRCPEIWISEPLHAALGEDERAVVLAHERAHAERRDPARLLAAAVVAPFHLPGVRSALVADLRLACEQACDARAARCVGDPLRVATTLLRVERLMQGSATPLRFAAALVDTSLPARVEALLALRTGPTPAARSARMRRGWLVLAAAVLLSSPLHHLAEHVLEGVLRSMVGLERLF